MRGNDVGNGHSFSELTHAHRQTHTHLRRVGEERRARCAGGRVVRRGRDERSAATFLLSGGRGSGGRRVDACMLGVAHSLISLVWRGATHESLRTCATGEAVAEADTRTV